MSSTVPATRISFKDVALLVGLEADGKLQDALATVVARARIPNGLFMDIINGLNTATLNYGHMHDLDNGEARSRLMAPLFTPIVAMFNHIVKITLVAITDERPTKRERIVHRYSSYGVIMLLVMELKYTVHSVQDRLDAIALLIAEALVCDNINAENKACIPFYMILYDGSTFQFLQFSDSVVRVVRFPFLNSPRLGMSHLILPDLRTTSLNDFMRNTRKIVEAFYSVLLQGFDSAFTAYVPPPNESLYKTKYAYYAYSLAVEGGKLHEVGKHDGAEDEANRAQRIVSHITEYAPCRFQVDCNLKCESSDKMRTL